MFEHITGKKFSDTDKNNTYKGYLTAKIIDAVVFLQEIEKNKREDNSSLLKQIETIVERLIQKK